MKNILSIQETALKWNVSERTVRKWCIYATINAIQINKEWAINSNQPCPTLNISEFNLQGLKKAVEDFNNWKEVARIYLDLDNRYVWTSLHLHNHENDHYIFGTEHEIYNKGLQKDNFREITKEQLFRLCYDKYLLDQLELELEIELEPPDFELEFQDNIN